MRNRTRSNQYGPLTYALMAAGIAMLWLQSSSVMGHSLETYPPYDMAPQINDRGQIVWKGWGTESKSLYLFNGTQTRKIATNASDSYFQLNNNGQVVWVGEVEKKVKKDEESFPFDIPDEEIFLYDLSTGLTTNISRRPENQDSSPAINDKGQIVWDGQVKPSRKIFLYDPSKGTATNISNSPDLDVSPQINAKGHVVWHGFGDRDKNIYFFDGTTTTQIAHGNFGAPFFYNGNVFWRNNYSSKPEALFLYDPSNNTTLNISDILNINNSSLKIKESGQIAWMTKEFQIYLYDFSNNTTSNISNNDFQNYSPQVNTAGQVAWNGDKGKNSVVFLYEGGTTHQLTESTEQNYVPKINNSGQIVWVERKGTDFDIIFNDGEKKTRILPSGTRPARLPRSKFVIPWD